MKKRFTLFLIYFCTNVIAQTDTARLNKYFTQLEKNNKAMTSVCLYDKGIFTYDRAIGYADAEKKIKSNVYTHYRIGSISKLFTAVMIMQLVDEKKVTLDTKLKTYFPTIRNSDKITIAHLLSHRSGIENFTNEADYAAYMESPKSEKELITIFEKLSSDFEPGTKFSYSNTNYVLLTFIIEKITKSTYAEQLLKRICAKAALADTRVGGKINTENNEAQSYNFENNQWVKTTETDMSIPRGAGNIVSTAKDLCLFIEALFNGKLVSASSLTQMKTIQDGYGYGMLQFPFDAKRFFGHTGGIDGFQSMLAYNEEDKLAFCILGNGYNYSINDIAIALLSAYYDKPYEIPAFEKRQMNAAESKSLEGTYNNSKIGMKITVFKKEDKLMAQATGQEAFLLDEVSALEYKFEAGGIYLSFIKEKDDLITGFRLKQGGMDILFDKE